VRRKIREHKQPDEGEQGETNIQDEVQQGGDGTDRMADVPASHDGLYTIKPITGKGLGFIAASKISKGTRILLEVPLFKTPDSTKDIGSAEIIVLQEVKSLTKDQQLCNYLVRLLRNRNNTQYIENNPFCLSRSTSSRSRHPTAKALTNSRLYPSVISGYPTERRLWP
jgi:hypothetical protein